MNNSTFASWDMIASGCARINTDRLWRMQEEMATFGAIPGPGVNRQAFSDEDIAARGAMLKWLESYNFEIFTDDIANIYIRRRGLNDRLPPIMTGSHMDSQPNGGRFDGIYGVLAGLEVLFALEECDIKTEHPLEVVAWSNEEGGRFSPGAMGSMIQTGAKDFESLQDVTDGEGIFLTDALAKVLAALSKTSHRPLKSPVSGYIEAHIEQGPILEMTNNTIGVVTGIQGTRWFNVDVHGESAHAGTTPLSVRRDALQSALAVIQRLNSMIADEPEDLRFTIGRFDVRPNTPNSVAENVSFSIDIRHPDVTVVERIGDAAMEICSGEIDRCDVIISENFNRPPCVFSKEVVDTVATAAARLGERHMLMTSGAFHDALFMDDICPTGMIFIPCERGISHNPKENASPDDLAAGARVLLASLLSLDRVLSEG